MYQISEQINTTNKNHFHDKIRKLIVDLGHNKGNKNDNSSPELTNMKNYLLLRIFDTPEKYVYYG